MRLFLISLFIFILILSGLATFNGVLISLAIPLVVYLGFALFYFPQTVKISIERVIRPARVHKGEPVYITLLIKNIGRHQKELILEDDIPQHLDLLEGKTSHVTSLLQGQTIELLYKLHGNRGIYKFKNVWLTTSDPHGLFTRRQSVDARGEIVILPRAPQLKRFSIRPRITKIYAGNVPSRFGGKGVEFFGVREYNQGDALRQINWRLSARFPRALFTNVFEQEKVADIWLILDARTRSNITKHNQSLFETMVDITSAVSHSLLKEGNRVGLLIYGGFLDWTYLGSGKRQREKILYALAGARPGDSLIFEKLENLPTRIFPPRSQVVLISPIQNDDLPFLLATRARGYQVLCLSPDLVEFERKKFEDTEAGLLAVRLVQIERKQLITKLRQSGIQVKNINPNRRVENSLSNLSRYIHTESHIYGL